MSSLWLHHDHAPATKDLQVLLHRGFDPHRVVHRRGDHDRTAGGQEDRRHQVVGLPAGCPRDHIRGRRRKQHHLRPVAKEHMGLRSLSVTRPHACQCRVAGDTLKRWRPDKARGRCGHRHPHAAAGLRQSRRQVHQLVGGYAAGDQKRDPQAAQLFRDRCWIERHDLECQLWRDRTPRMISSTSATARSRSSLTTTWS